MHTTASDGTYTPEELVEKACGLELAAIAVTDHDTLRGVAKVRKAAEGRNLIVVSGVELSTIYDGKDIHILGYGVDAADERLEARLESFRNARFSRAEEMVRLLRGLGIELEMDDVLAVSQGAAVGRPHVATALLEKGYVQTFEEAFHRYIGNDGPAYVPKYRLTPAEGVSLLREAGSVPVLAHPGTVKRDELIGELADKGMLGLEVIHPKHDPYLREHYRKLAEEYDLIMTGGSDSHGERDSEALMGKHVVSATLVGELEKLRREVVLKGKSVEHQPEEGG